MKIQHNISLKSYNTFGIDVMAKHFVAINSINDLKDVLSLTAYPKKFILGGGSNILLTRNIDDLVVFINLKGIKITTHTDKHVYVEAAAGENWHQFVLWCLQHDFGGVENLSLIPGNVGTAPIQNIGAYGVELKDIFHSCSAINTITGEIETFNNEQCKFAYRNSIFKQEAKGKYIITNVVFKLTKSDHQLHTDYGAIREELENLKISDPSIQDVSKAVINIRQSKLPDPKEIGNSGSFFKNPVISVFHFNDLKQNFPEIPSYKVSEDMVKVPAGWLIEKAGFKGKSFGNYGVHDKQALVLVNHGGAVGSNIYKLSQLIQTTIERLFEIKLEAEVNII